MRALYTAASGMSAQQMRIDSIANNIANVGTTGFKKSRVEFRDLFYETLRAPGATSQADSVLPTGVQIGHGVELAAISRIPTAGDVQPTGVAEDLSINGVGFFQVDKPGGETHYTRDGSFKRDRDGNMVTTQGYLLIPTITVPSDALNLTILPDGTVSADQPGSATPTVLGQIELARFTSPAGLRAVGTNLFVATESSGDPETGTADQNGFGKLTSGSLEGSNVNVAEELVQMILAQRAFEVNSRVISTSDQMLQAASNLGR